MIADVGKKFSDYCPKMQRQGALQCSSSTKELCAYSAPSLTIDEMALRETRLLASCSPARKIKTENLTLAQMQSWLLYLRNFDANRSGTEWQTLKTWLGEAASQQQFDQFKKGPWIEVFLSIKMLTTLFNNKCSYSLKYLFPADAYAVTQFCSRKLRFDDCQYINITFLHKY